MALCTYTGYCVDTTVGILHMCYDLYCVGTVGAIN